MTTTIRRMTLSVAGLALAAVSLTACGGDSDSDDGASAGSDTSASAGESAGSDPSADSSDEADTEDESDVPDASDSEFCSIYGDFFQQVSSSLGSGGDIATVIPQLKEFADQLEEAGAPDGIPEDAERGFEISIEAIQDLPDDATQEDLLNNAQDYSAEDQAAAAAFGQYVTTACPDLVPTVPTPSAP